MKTLQSLFVALFTILLIASCDSSTSPESDDQGTRIGTWMVYESENRGEWVGKESSDKAKTFTTDAVGDTIFLDQPENRELYFVDEGDHYRIWYRDYNYSQTFIDTSEANSQIHFENDIATGGAAFGMSEEWISWNNTIEELSCDFAESSSSDTLKMNWMNDSGGIYKSIHVNASGIIEAIKTAKGCF